MRTFILKSLNNSNVARRFMVLCLLYSVVFLFGVVFSHFFLPEGILKGKTVGETLSFSTSVLTSTLQIFFFNLISAFVIIFGSLFSKMKTKQKIPFSTGVNGLLLLSVINSIALGTNSFSISMGNLSLLNKIIGLFNIFKVAALWEIVGLILITSAFSWNKALIISDGKKVQTKKIKELKFQRSEVIVMIIGFIFMIIGAFTESRAIINSH